MRFLVLIFLFKIVSQHLFKEKDTEVDKKEGLDPSILYKKALDIKEQLEEKVIDLNKADMEDNKSLDTGQLRRQEEELIHLDKKLKKLAGENELLRQKLEARPDKKTSKKQELLQGLLIGEILERPKSLRNYDRYQK